jgi:hypothetical protein
VKLVHVRLLTDQRGWPPDIHRDPKVRLGFTWCKWRGGGGAAQQESENILRKKLANDRSAGLN